MNFWNSSKRWIWWCVWPVLAACCQCPPSTAPSLALDRGQAARQELVQATTNGLNTAELTLTVGDEKARIVSRAAAAVIFEVPAAAPAGVQTVRAEAEGRVAESQLVVFGDDVQPGKVTVLLTRELSPEALAQRLRAIDPTFRVERVRPLDPSGTLEGPCAGALAEIDVSGRPLGEALELLERLEQDDPGLVLAIDPRSAPGVDAVTVDAAGAVGARTARAARGSSGTGVLIAILDTGVSPHPDLGGRLRLDLAHNALTGGTDVTDGYTADSAGHGTAAAVLAAGARWGVAPGAEVVPIKVCDDGGTCLSSDVVVGSCAALAAAGEKGLARLVMSYSLGGETEIGALTAVLSYALSQGVLVAAAGGNQGDPRAFPQPAPRHYPAASALPGLLAVSALSASDAPACVTFESVPNVGGDVTYGVGESFEDGGATVTLAPFTLGDGTLFQGGTAYADVGLVSGGSGQALWTNNVVAAFDFGGEVGGVTVRFADHGGSENVVLNGELFNLSTLDELPTSVGALSVSVGGAPTAGELMVLGPVTGFGIGGQEFALDDVCPVQGAEAEWRPAVFSTQGDYLDLAAPGDGVTSGAPDGGLATYSGTSFATPLAAGALALWREAEPGLSAAEVEAGLVAAARPLPHPAAAVGAGMLELREKP